MSHDISHDTLGTNGHSVRPPGLDAAASNVPHGAILENAPIQFIYCNPKLIIQYANAAARATLEGLEGVLDLTVDKIVGDHVRPRLTGNERARITAKPRHG